MNATRSPHAPPPSRGDPSPRPARSPSSAAPPFGRLVLAALRSVGIEYVALDHLRKAKKNATDNPEAYVTLWRLLHDLVLVVLLDFEVDIDAVRAAAKDRPSPDAFLQWQELVRHYLHEWGFVCRAFYEGQGGSIAPSVLLLAVAWLLAYSRFFERQHTAILAIYLQTKATMPRLPPYPNDVAIPATAVVEAVTSVEASSQQLRERIRGDVDATARLHQLQALVGRIHMHQRSLQTSLEAYDRMLKLLDERQRANGAVDDDELLPAFALQVFANGKGQLELHVRVLTERLQMIEDEKLFYKWTNGLVLQYTPDPDRADRQDPIAALESQCAPLYADILSAKAALEQSAELYQQLARSFAVEKKKWDQKTKTRTQQAKMDEKMDKLRHDIATNELFDVDALFLDRNRPSTPTNKTRGDATRKVIEQGDLERLQQQLERVMREITTDYCHTALI